MLDRWIPWNRHGTTSNALFLDGHAKSVTKVEGYKPMYPDGVVYKDPLFFEK